jgi:hypothetical protein
MKSLSFLLNCRVPVLNGEAEERRGMPAADLGSSRAKF